MAIESMTLREMFGKSVRIGMTKAIMPPTQWIRLFKTHTVQKRGDILLNRMTRNTSCGAARSCAIGATARVTVFQHACRFQLAPA